MNSSGQSNALAKPNSDPVSNGAAVIEIAESKAQQNIKFLPKGKIITSIPEVIRHEFLNPFLEQEDFEKLNQTGTLIHGSVYIPPSQYAENYCSKILGYGQSIWDDERELLDHGYLGAIIFLVCLGPTLVGYVLSHPVAWCSFIGCYVRGEYNDSIGLNPAAVTKGLSLDNKFRAAKKTVVTLVSASLTDDSSQILAPLEKFKARHANAFTDRYSMQRWVDEQKKFVTIKDNQHQKIYLQRIQTNCCLRFFKTTKKASQNYPCCVSAPIQPEMKR